MTQNNALIGLCSWITLVRAQHGDWMIADDGTAALVLTAQLSNNFQVGMFTTDGRPPQPLLAYSQDLWWFAQAWAHITVTPQALVLTAAAPNPLLVVAPTDRPKSMVALHQAVRHGGRDWLCAPYAQSYLDRLVHAECLQRRPIAQLGDLQLDASCEIANRCVEDDEWISTLLPRFR